MSRKPINPKKRFLILNRDGFTCQYCGLKAGQGVQLQIDHKIPISKGGDDSLENLITSCFECNIGKGDMDDEKINIIAERTNKNDKTKKELNKFFEVWNKNGYGNIDKNTTTLLSIYFKEKGHNFNLEFLEEGQGLFFYESELDVFGFAETEKPIWKNDCAESMNNRLNYILTVKLLDLVKEGKLKNNYTIQKFSYFYNEIIGHKE